jgi:hypothetical protein
VVKFGNRSVTSTVDAAGLASVMSPKFTKKGSYKIVVTYAGNANVAGSVSASHTLKVT